MKFFPTGLLTIKISLNLLLQFHLSKLKSECGDNIPMLWVSWQTLFNLVEKKKLFGDKIFWRIFLLKKNTCCQQQSNWFWGIPNWRLSLEEKTHHPNPLWYKLVVILNVSNLYFTSIKGLNLLISFNSTLLQVLKKSELFLSNYQKSAKHNSAAHTHFASSSS